MLTYFPTVSSLSGPCNTENSGALAGGGQAHIKLLDGPGRVVQEVARQGEVMQRPTLGLALVQLVAEGQAAQVYQVLIQR
ncbi:hypothetical protein [Fibrella arboris]|uniref:hypothetical protein n=1 Tax=Fibrella arboris TaxID=3242486 RepID=UPI003521E931